MPRRPGLVLVTVTLTGLAWLPGGAPRARAGDQRAAPVNETYTTECGACHVPYPPRRLSARSWAAVMEGLDRHFGTDAALDSAAAAEVAAFLRAHAGRDRGGPTTTRITDTPWFRREHREVPAAVWTRADVQSRANCGACHPAADRGQYDDDTVRVPR
jgi:nitrate/TMAO reductase-like tetraheme cytochrome c subunit